VALLNQSCFGRIAFVFDIHCFLFGEMKFCQLPMLQVTHHCFLPCYRSAKVFWKIFSGG